MRVLVVGGGGREHALCWRLAQSPNVERIWSAPGNAGIAELATLVQLDAGDVSGIVEFAERERIDLTVVGPEAPLVAGLADELEARGLPVFGPTRDAARLEGSKAWARSLCADHGIPAAASRVFHEIDPALHYLDDLDAPYVVKADGLAQGKGVLIAQDREEARRALEACLITRTFGDAGTRVLVEEYLEGFEVSALALADGTTMVPLALAHDYKRALDGDRGSNTGGMGAFSPVPQVGPETEREIVSTVLQATARALESEGIRYQGVVYAGLMLTAEGPKVLEFNARFGDPETQVILPRLQADLAQVLLACAEGKLSTQELAWTSDAGVGVVVASGGYPGVHVTGAPIAGLEVAGSLEGVQIFHAGTIARDGRVVTAGGRVLTVTAIGADVAEARDRAYRACSLIEFEGMAYRRDIAELSDQRAG